MTPPTSYLHFVCGNCFHEIYLLTIDEATKCYCRKCHLPMNEVRIVEKVKCRASNKQCKGCRK